MKAVEEAKAKGKNTKNALQGKQSIMNGRALFSFNPDLFKETEEEAKAAAITEE